MCPAAVAVVWIMLLKYSWVAFDVRGVFQCKVLSSRSFRSALWLSDRISGIPAGFLVFGVFFGACRLPKLI